VDHVFNAQHTSYLKPPQLTPPMLRTFLLVLS